MQLLKKRNSIPTKQIAMPKKSKDNVAYVNQIPKSKSADVNNVNTMPIIQIDIPIKYESDNFLELLNSFFLHTIHSVKTEKNLRKPKRTKLPLIPRFVTDSQKGALSLKDYTAPNSIIINRVSSSSKNSMKCSVNLVNQKRLLSVSCSVHFSH